MLKLKHFPSIYSNQMSQAKPTTIREALTRWEERKRKKGSEATEVDLQFQWPPIEKMDNTLGTLENCRKLSLSSNMIIKIEGLAGMKNLKILSLARNNIRTLLGIEAVAESLEELWISYNAIDRVRGIGSLKLLKVLYISHNQIKEWQEYQRLRDCPLLSELLFLGNPLCETMDEADYRTMATLKLPQLRKLDGEPVFDQPEY